MIKADIMHTQKGGADGYNSCAVVIADSPDLDAEHYIELHEGRRHGLSSTRGVSNLRQGVSPTYVVSPLPARARSPPHTLTLALAGRGEGATATADKTTTTADDDNHTTV
jgi:hypothetical protein